MSKLLELPLFVLNARVKASLSAAEGAKALMEEKNLEPAPPPGETAYPPFDVGDDSNGLLLLPGRDSEESRATVGTKGAELTDRSDEGRMRPLDFGFRLKTLASGLSFPSAVGVEVGVVEEPGAMDWEDDREESAVVVVGEDTEGVDEGEVNHLLGARLEANDRLSSWSSSVTKQKKSQ